MEKHHVPAPQLRRRRRLGLIASVTLGALTLVACAGPGDEGTVSDINVIGWGGTYGDALAKYIGDPFAADTGISMVLQEQATAADSLAKLQAEIKSPTTDIWLTTGALPYLMAKQGGLQELDPSIVTNLADLFPSTVLKVDGKVYAVPVHLGAELIIVDRDRIKQFVPNYDKSMLSSWKFLYRPELKNQIAIAPFSGLYGATLIGASMPYGGSEHDEEAFFSAMRRLAPNVRTIPTSSFVPLFQTHEVVASMGSPADALELIESGANVDIGYPLDPLEMFLDYIVALKNGPAGANVALDFINRAIAPKTLSGYDGALGYMSPNSKSVQPKLKGLPVLTTDDMLSKGWTVDYDVAIQNFDAWNERFQKEIVPLFGK